MPLLLGMDGKKLSKRKNPTSAFYYRDAGFLPEAFRNFLSLMGYSMAEDREIYSIEDLIQSFDVSRIGLSGAVFDTKKLEWMNQQYLIEKIPQNELWPRIRDWKLNDTFMEQLMPLVHTRIHTFADFIKLCDFFFINDLSWTIELFTPKNLDKEIAASLLQCLLWGLEEKEQWTRDHFEEVSKSVAQIFEVHYKKIMIPILFATFMGKHQGPPLFDSFVLLGEHLARARILQAIQFLGGISNKKMVELKKIWDSKSLETQHQ